MRSKGNYNQKIFITSISGYGLTRRNKISKAKMNKKAEIGSPRPAPFPSEK